ncbi:MAG: TlpA family protein disulfide reductase [Putridiphycobacter sp.]
MKKNLVNSIKGILFIGIAIFLGLKFESSLFNLIGKLPLIGWVKGSILLRLIISLSFARGLQLIVKMLTHKIKPALVLLVGVFLGFGVSFLTPIYSTDYGNLGQTDFALDLNLLNTETNNFLNQNNKPALVAFFTSTCPHCKAASEKLGLMQKNGNIPQVFAIFPGTKEDTERFIQNHNAQTFYNVILQNDDAFLELSGGSFPSIFLLDEKGNTIKHWYGDEMNYNALDYISTFE